MTHHSSKRSLIRQVLAVTLAAAGLTPAHADLPTYRLIVGYTAGGPVDGAARLIAPYLGKELNANVIVENKVGAGGAMGGDAVAKSAPNAPIIFFAASPTMTISPHILKAMPFDPAKDVTPIAPIVSYYNVLVANKDLPFKTVPELVTYAKANPGKLSYGSAGNGASNHLSGELFALRTGTQLLHVPYKGNAPAMADVMGGQISMMFDIISTARNYIQGGRVRAIAVTSRDRNTSLPDVPSMREMGIADYDVGGWYGLYGPPKMPAAEVTRWNDAARRALANEELKAKLIEQGYDLWPGNGQTLAERAAKELALWGTVTKGIPQQ